MSAVRPTIHVTNWASRALHGPGAHYTIMTRPRSWEYGAGRVLSLCPDADDLAAVRAGDLSSEPYMDACRARFARHRLEPGWLIAARTRGGSVAVADGDTLCCACSRSAAARRECHRVVAADLLAAGGWRVVLDGVEIGARQEVARDERTPTSDPKHGGYIREPKQAVKSAGEGP